MLIPPGPDHTPSHPTLLSPPLHHLGLLTGYYLSETPPQICGTVRKRDIEKRLGHYRIHPIHIRKHDAHETLTPQMDANP